MSVVAGVPGDAGPFLRNGEVIDLIPRRPLLDAAGLDAEELGVDRSEDCGAGVGTWGVGFTGMGSGDQEEAEEDVGEDS